jgi:hypothetical protein
VSARQLTDGFNGKDKYVQFIEGFGVLDLAAIHLERPDWVHLVAGEYVEVTGETLQDFVFLWRRRGFQVMEITADQAAEFREQSSAWSDARAKFYRATDALYEQRKVFLVVP